MCCCNERWEAAYRRFETPEQERQKFRKRFISLGIDKLHPDSVIVDVFCGTGNGLRVLKDWGFTNLTGVDLSPDLLKKAPTDVRRIVADCTDLRFPEASVDYFIVQGGLHHLPKIPEDLDLCLKEISGALQNGGKFYVIEPWNTLFLKLVHAITRQPLARKRFPRLDAFATMVEEEWDTYNQWLTNADVVTECFQRNFSSVEMRTG